MNKQQYEQSLSDKAQVSVTACTNHKPKGYGNARLVVCDRVETGHQCPECKTIYPYENQAS